jgi:GT2 family glycosyltransferase
MTFRREVFDAVGGFRSDLGRIGTLPIGCEETELCLRVHQYAPTSMFLYLPKASVLHRVPAQRTSWRYFITRCYAEGISKATIAKYIDPRESLTSERSYVLRTLPLGIVHNLLDALTHHDMYALMRAGAIVMGLLVTIAGYLGGLLINTPWRKRKGKAKNWCRHANAI